LKKFRGQKRYYRNLELNADKFILDLSEDCWYDMWHTHIDWRGYSEISWKHHRLHIKILLEMFNKALNQLENYSKPYQIFIFIDFNNGSSDAIYFHTPSPQNKFPMKIDEIEWGIKPPIEFVDLIDLEKFQVGRLIKVDEKNYFIISKNHGVTI
jgi:hypothetical protein